VAKVNVRKSVKVTVRNSAIRRCHWADSNELLAKYHDAEWGVPVHDDRLLFEMLNLEGAQAGLSWLIVLRKRASYRKAFDRFNPLKIVAYDARKRAALMRDEGIVRNRLKINAVIENAKSFLLVKREFGSFDRFIWQFVGGEPIRVVGARGGSAGAGKRYGPAGRAARLLAAKKASEAMSKELKKRGFRFVGPTICYAYMQGVGMINEHSAECFRRGL
jgi:DNA-3-methyladenine glycosylase I